MKKLLLCLLFLFPLHSYAFDWTTQLAILSLRYDVDPSLTIAIAKCESDLNPHAINHNKNGTTDYGIFQWNVETWRPYFLKRGLDIYDPIDNIEAGIWMIKTKGTSDWRYSQACWKNWNTPYRTFYSSLARNY